jgi:Mn2+/Fe2+ NRAMP family transporter
MIIAGSIVGSGELIATTKVGAEAGFCLLWLIIVGCAIKVFAQVEMGRHTVASGQTPLDALNEVPGPRLRVNWIVWVWAIVMLVGLAQQGGIAGSVGQALMIRLPLTDSGRQYNRLQDEWIKSDVQLALMRKGSGAVDASQAAVSDLMMKRESLREKIAECRSASDAYWWTTLLAVITSLMLFVGRYELIQFVSTALVGVFTAVTILTVIVLQTQPDWRMTSRELIEGLSFRLPTSDDFTSTNALFTGMAAFGIIGVAAMELIQYPYWCLEKGYARHAGPRDETQEWARRAQGWMRVMRVDAWLSMVVYTLATVGFYLLGAAVLGRTGLNPKDNDLVRTLAEMYVPVFGSWAPDVFLVGAFAVLYSTFFVAAAGNARTIADALGLFGVADRSDESRARRTRILSALWPLAAVGIYWLIGWYRAVQSPDTLVLAAGIGNSILLPMVGVGALWFRMRRCAEPLRPGRLWDVMLVLSVAGLAIAGAWSFYTAILKLIR